MAELTEIYIWRQSLKQGRLEISHDINTKQEALSDAKRKCEMDKRVHKVAYYKINEEGDQRIFCSYTNPRGEALIGETKDEAPKKKKRKKKPKPTLMSKIKSAIKLGN